VGAFLTYEYSKYTDLNWIIRRKRNLLQYKVCILVKHKIMLIGTYEYRMSTHNIHRDMCNMFIHTLFFLHDNV